MTLVCRPKGRGNWRIYEIEIKQIPADLFTFKPGYVFQLGPWRLRVIEVKP